MAAVDTEHVLEVAAAEDEDSVEAISAESPDPALGVSTPLAPATRIRIARSEADAATVRAEMGGSAVLAPTPSNCLPQPRIDPIDYALA